MLSCCRRKGVANRDTPSLIRIYVLCDGISANGIAKIGSDVIGAERRFAVFVGVDANRRNASTLMGLTTPGPH
jgi:hypothetical protein